jgi:hypothetical protein
MEKEKYNKLCPLEYTTSMIYHTYEENQSDDILMKKSIKIAVISEATRLKG